MSKQKDRPQSALERHIKRQAKVFKKTLGISHARALDHAARNAGFENYTAFIKSEQS